MEAICAAKHTLGEPRVLVSRDALLHNARLIRRAAGPRVRVCAIVKADAYGHGAAVVADALCNFTTLTPVRATGVQQPPPPTTSPASPSPAAAAPRSR